MTYTPGIGFGGVLDGDNEGLKEPLLIMIGGAPGTGKSSVASRLYRRLENSVWLDGDDLWRMNPFRVTEARKEMVLNNAAFMLDSFIKESFSYIIFSWVMHEPDIVKRILERIPESGYRMLHYTMVCAETKLLQRISGTNRDPGLCLARLHSARENYPEAIDTDNMSVEDLVQYILRDIQAG